MRHGGSRSEAREATPPLPAKGPVLEGPANALAAFLRAVDRVPPLTHDQEVAAARLIEQGEQEILEAVLRTPVGQKELLALAEQLRRGRISLRNLIRDHNDQRLDPAVRREDLLGRFADLEQRSEAALDLERRLQVGDLSAEGARVAEARLARHREEIRASLRDAHLAWEPVRTIARRIRNLAQRAEEADAQGASHEVHERARNGLPLADLQAVRDDIVRGERTADRGRATLVESYLWLVQMIARKQRGRGLPFLDLVQEGAIGLIRAAEKFDHRMGYRFPTYATWWIRSSVARAATEQGRTVRIPSSAVLTLRRLSAKQQEMRRERDRDPTSEELAEALDLPVDQVLSLLLVSGRTTSLQQPRGDPDGAVHQDFLEDDRMGVPSDALAFADLSGVLHEALKTLSPREQRILRQRFGINGDEEHTLAAIGEAMGVSRERIRQLESRALHKLRRLGVIQELEPYLKE